MDAVDCGVCGHSEPSYCKMLEHMCQNHADSPLELALQAEEFEKCVSMFRASLEHSAADLRVEGMPLSTPQRSSKRCELGSAVLQTAHSSVKICPFCPHRLVSLEDFMEHCVVAHKVSVGIAVILDLMLKTKHADAVRNESLYCPFCNIAPSVKDELEKHMYEEFSYAPMQCDACSYSTSSRESLKEHFRVSHPQRQPAFTVCRHADFESWVASFIAGQEAHRRVLEKPYQCVRCGERHRCTKELRMHLNAHLQYYPHHCTLCEVCFASQQDVEEHQGTSHGLTDVYSRVEVRFESEEVKIDDDIDKAMEKLRTAMESPPGSQCVWMGCPYSSSNPTELVAHMKAHIQQRKVCKTCQFSSYCDDVIAWHSREHRAVSSRSKKVLNPVPKVKSGAFACGWCAYRCLSSMEIHTHCQVAHPGKAVKLMAPKLNGPHAPAARIVQSAQSSRREDVTNGADESAKVDQVIDVEKQGDVVLPVRDIVVRDQQPSSTKVPLNPVLTSAVPKNKARAYACCWCKFRGPSSMGIRMHCKNVHPGKAVKLIAPKLKKRR